MKKSKRYVLVKSNINFIRSIWAGASYEVWYVTKDYYVVWGSNGKSVDLPKQHVAIIW